MNVDLKPGDLAKEREAISDALSLMLGRLEVLEAAQQGRRKPRRSRTMLDYKEWEFWFANRLNIRVGRFLPHWKIGIRFGTPYGDIIGFSVDILCFWLGVEWVVPERWRKH